MFKRMHYLILPLRGSPVVRAVEACSIISFRMAIAFWKYNCFMSRLLDSDYGTCMARPLSRMDNVVDVDVLQFSLSAWKDGRLIRCPSGFGL